MTSIDQNTQNFIIYRFERRLKLVSFTRELCAGVQVPLNQWFKITGLPEDAHLVGLFPDYTTLEFVAVIWSSEFPIVEKGMVLERINVNVETNSTPRL